MADGKESFFAELPADEFLPQEAAARSALLDLLNWRHGAFPLIEWIDRRLGGEIRTRVGESGLGEISLQSDGDGAADSTRPMDPEVFFASLPGDAFSPEEEALRESIFDFLANWKSPTLANLADMEADKGVKACARKLLPSDMQISDWIERRIGEEVTLRKDSESQPPTIVLLPAARRIVTAKYNTIMRAKVPGKTPPAPARPPPPPPVRGAKANAGASRTAGMTKEAFFASLSKDELSNEEAVLREVILKWLEEWPRRRGNTGKTMKLSECGQDPEVQKKRQALLPNSVQLHEWIDYRIGGEVELRKDEQGWYEISIRGQMPPAKKVAKKDPAAVVKAASEAADAFFAGLPADELTEQELNLRQAILDFLDLNATDSAAPLLSDASKDSAIAAAKASFLPPEVAIRVWADRRIGGEVEIAKDPKSGVLLIRPRGSTAVAAGGTKEATTPSKDEFFEKLPSDCFTEGEEALRDALLTFLENWKESEPPTLSNALSDPAVRSTRIKVLPKGAPVSLRDWIDRRMGGEIEMSPDAAGQVRFGIRGEVNFTDDSKKRKVDNNKVGGKGSQAPANKKGRTDGKGSSGRGR